MKKVFLAVAVAMFSLLCACSDKKDEPKGPDTPDTPDQPGEETIEPLKKVPFTKGLNIDDWLNVDEYHWFNPDTYTEKDFDNLKSLGIDVLRLPLNFPVFMESAPSYTFRSEFLETLDKAIDMAEARDMYIILDNHSYFGSRLFPSGYGEELVASGFRQLAMRYKDRSDKVVFELFNEPGGSYLEQHYSEMQGRLIAEIRNYDPKHIIIVTATDNVGLQGLPEYDDKRLVYTFHYYAPHLFTHQGANWDNSPQADFTGVHFPYDPATPLAPMPDSFKGNTWCEGYYNNYPVEGTEEYMGQKLMSYYSWAVQKGKLLFCGEFGALTTAPAPDRYNWYKSLTDYMAAYGIAWTAWQYRDTKTPNFGIFKGANVFESGLDVQLLRALGFTLPAGYESGLPPITFYEDEIPFWWRGGQGWDGYVPKIDYVCKEQPYDGSVNCIRFDIDNVYGSLTMEIWPQIDLTEYYEANATLEFMVRTTDEIDGLHVRFVQYKTGAPYQWRIMSDLSTEGGASEHNLFKADGQWHKISIPLKNMWIRGCMGGTWKDEPGEGDEGFAWDMVNHLEFAPEGNKNLLGKTLYIDNVILKK